MADLPRSDRIPVGASSNIIDSPFRNSNLARIGTFAQANSRVDCYKSLAAERHGQADTPSLAGECSTRSGRAREWMEAGALSDNGALMEIGPRTCPPDWPGTRASEARSLTAERQRQTYDQFPRFFIRAIARFACAQVTNLSHDTFVTVATDLRQTHRSREIGARQAAWAIPPSFPRPRVT
jgi:hypothetical protein